MSSSESEATQFFPENRQSRGNLDLALKDACFFYSLVEISSAQSILGWGALMQGFYMQIYPFISTTAKPLKDAEEATMVQIIILSSLPKPFLAFQFRRRISRRQSDSSSCMCSKASAFTLALTVLFLADSSLLSSHLTWLWFPCVCNSLGFIVMCQISFAGRDGDEAGFLFLLFSLHLLYQVVPLALCESGDGSTTEEFGRRWSTLAPERHHACSKDWMLLWRP